MRVFLTGATGFLGAEIAHALTARGHVCVALARPGSSAARLKRLAPGAELIEGDLFALADWRDALAQFAPEALIHCGWRGVAGDARNDLAQLDNIVMSAQLALAALSSGARTLIGVGSQAEYGPRAVACREEDAPAPDTLYGVAKLGAGNAFATLARLHDARCVWGRVFSLYGPGNDGPWLVPSLLRALTAGETLALTACEQMWEFTHVRDAAQGFVDLLEQPQAAGVFNVASGAALPLREAVEMLRDLAAPAAQLAFGARPYRPDQVMRLEADIARMRAVVGWRPRIALRDGFAETVASYRPAQAAA